MAKDALEQYGEDITQFAAKRQIHIFGIIGLLGEQSNLSTMSIIGGAEPILDVMSQDMLGLCIKGLIANGHGPELPELLEQIIAQAVEEINEEMNEQAKGVPENVTSH